MRRLIIIIGIVAIILIAYFVFSSLVNNEPDVSIPSNQVTESEDGKGVHGGGDGQGGNNGGGSEGGSGGDTGGGSGGGN